MNKNNIEVMSNLLSNINKGGRYTKIFVLFICLFLFFANIVRSINTIDSLKTQRLAGFCKVWGFLKYYQDDKIPKNVCWDSVFFKFTKEVELSKSNEEYNSVINNLIDITYKYNKFKKETPEDTTEKAIADFSWLSDTNRFSKIVCAKLLNIKKYFKPHHNKFIKFTYYYEFILKNEANYAFENKDEIKLLGLAKYWNIVNYFNPNKELAKENWDKVLVDFIPKVLNASDIYEYHLVLLELTAELNDTHARYPGSFSPNVDRYLFYDYVLRFPFQIYVHNNHVIVCKIDSNISKRYELSCGDTITEIDGKTTEQIIEYYSRYIGASNKNQAESFIKILIAKGRNITVKKGNQFVNKEIEFANIPSDDTTNEKHIIKFLNDSTGYFYMCNIKRKDISNAINIFINTKYLILDLRTYPDNDFLTFYLLKQLINHKTNVMITYELNLLKPGYLIQGNLSNPGSNNKNKKIYQGQIIVLIDENSASSPEYYGLFLKVVPNCIFIGRQTGGCPGGVCGDIYLPGEFSAYFTAEKVLFPDGTSAQGPGIIPDIYVSPCSCEFGKDEILERAMEYIKFKK